SKHVRCEDFIDVVGVAFFELVFKRHREVRTEQALVQDAENPPVIVSRHADSVNAGGSILVITWSVAHLGAQRIAPSDRERSLEFERVCPANVIVSRIPRAIVIVTISELDPPVATEPLLNFRPHIRIDRIGILLDKWIPFQTIRREPRHSRVERQAILKLLLENIVVVDLTILRRSFERDLSSRLRVEPLNKLLAILSRQTLTDSIKLVRMVVAVQSNLIVC